ncbi:MAG: tRNA1(Val) (adenine(37)-N6)-methyltransferase [Owenweeksia sp.]
MANDWFRFKQFTIHHDQCAHKVGTDGVLLGAWVKPKKARSILDIGSGSGLIALMMAQRFPEAGIMGVELDKASYLQSVENIEASPFRERVAIYHDDFLKHDFKDRTFDLIVSNPPFFDRAYLSGNSVRDRARHTFSLSHDQMLEKAMNLLREDGTINLILPPDEAEKAVLHPGLLTHRKTLVFNHEGGDVKRWLISLGLHKPAQPEITELAIRSNASDFSEDYQNLTGEFYLNF